MTEVEPEDVATGQDGERELRGTRSERGPSQRDEDGERELRGTRSERGPSQRSEVIELDCRGQRCPLPVITLAKRLAELPVGAVLRVLADDPAAASDIPAWCRLRGHEYLGTSDGTADAYLVRRSH